MRSSLLQGASTATGATFGRGRRPAGLPRELGALLSVSYGFGGDGAFPTQWEAVSVLGAFCAVFAAGAYAGLKMNWQKR